MLGAHGFEPAAVDDLCCDQLVNTPVTQINDGRSWFDIEVLQQVSGLLNLFGQGVAFIGVAGECPVADDQTLFVGDRDAGLDAELEGPAALALFDALGLRCVQGIKLGLVLGLLSADAFGQGHPVVQFVLRMLAQFGHLALNLSQDDPEKGPLPAQHPLKLLN